MTFDKDQYWKRRNNKVDVVIIDPTTKKKPKEILTEQLAPLRGQGDIPKPNIIPKGQPVTIVDSKGKSKEFLNAQGSHVTQMNKKLVYINRKMARGKVVDRSFTKRGAEHNEPAEKIEEHNNYPINVITNHERHKWREMLRSKNEA